MYVRDAKNRDEVWLLDHIEEMGLDGESFRSRDYVVAVDEETNQRAGFGRVRIHKPGDDDGDFCELTSIGVPEAWRGQGVGAHVVERLIDEAGDDGFEVVYSFTTLPAYLAQFGFDRVEADDLPDAVRERFEAVREGEDDAVALRLRVDAFEMPPRLRERFKTAVPAVESDEAAIEETAEDFGIDPEETTYKYDTGR